ncbi:MAG: hypothetical protein COX62_03905 [Deltaproteobacteria bacterium CG_4_10_14_0_2_um_filter_43_8]|nr:MAG: hypothetical protein COV43_00955 [Deltaproteobacteria bacterium CG11_big_fil_rev_8_21_14_0_20_42_23]PJA20856.1 MAG: hypothetical protein COX62_03905 [Deltaproteobacteria bacterium CG_4_10_14_0_2_um_filter_43_8]PJC63575.1 MAG: hypothetical protein CO021_09035 [Deltaproteobacteria bacterium CG_4_9_14_0_2_um_filter_42_21]
MFGSLFLLFTVTLLPFFELRASIPLGILSGTLQLPLGYQMSGLGLNWALVFIICVFSNAFLGLILYPLINRFIHLLEHIPTFGKHWTKFTHRTQAKIHPYVEKWGTLGIALFVAVPLPGSGTYSGALGAYLLGLSFKQFLIANTIGVFLAGAAVTLITVSGNGLFKLFFS